MHIIEKYKGHNILKLKRHKFDQYPLSFGLEKAELILNNLEAIREFVKKNKKR